MLWDEGGGSGGNNTSIPKDRTPEPLGPWDGKTGSGHLALSSVQGLKVFMVLENKKKACVAPSKHCLHSCSFNFSASSSWMPTL